MKRFRASEFATWIGLTVLGICIFAVFYALGATTGRSAEDQRAYVKQAVEQAAVQCYALEGAYPPDVAYLVDHYGVKYDDKQFFIHYRVYGSNIRPEIEVFLNAEEE